MRPRSLLRACLVLGLLGCQPPSSEETIEADARDDALVVEVRVDEDDASLLTEFDVRDAPAGEYLTFASDARPTDVAAAMALDVDACLRDGGRCEVPGVGRFAGRTTVTAGGPSSLSAASTWGPARTAYFTLVRRGGDAGVPFRAKVTVTLEVNRGCGNPGPPDVRAVDPAAG